ncbi:MAG TPA: carboxymuconolactone decarboxylase family protein [Polyangiaceae bacterium]|nr:carboxymuconolactone decarboxylase family protein [Polyangiaceae bacterium]
MSRIATPATIAASPAAAQRSLEGVQKQLGSVPNLFRIVANSPAALEGYLGLNAALSKGRIDGPTRERLAVAVAELNGCEYCLSAHAYLGKNLAKLDDAELRRNQEGSSSDAKAAAALLFATKLVRARGHVTDADVLAVKRAGYDDAQVVEIVAHVALNTLTNYVNSALGTELDFPKVSPLGASVEERAGAAAAPAAVS